MNYLLDNKKKRNTPVKIIFGVLLVATLFFFRTSIFNGLSYVSGGVFRPLLSSGNTAGGKLQSIGAYFSSRNSLYNENVNLKTRLDTDVAERAHYDSVVRENTELKEILERKKVETPMILASILAKPNQSPYDTLLIDIGKDKGMQVGQTVFAFGSIPIGRIAEVYINTSKVILFSNSGEKTQVVISGPNIFAELVGRGGNNFEMILPRDMTLLKDDQVVLPGIDPYVVATVQTIISDQREAFQKALLASPVNIQSLKFVEVAI